MKKTLNLEIDSKSWQQAPAAFRKACPFPADQKRTSVDFLAALLWTGISTISVQMPQWWLASGWAILRYLGAADHATKSLRLHSAVKALETHAIQVLSDDWGVGISLQWLASRLNYKQIAHGRSTLEYLKSEGLADYKQRNKKNGAAKCPDFFAMDGLNGIHIIECKGNQKSSKETARQFTAGREQKRNIRFVNETLVGQRLLSGLAIANASSKGRSTLHIADPPPGHDTNDGIWPQETYLINTHEAAPIHRSMNKVALIQGLLLAGAFRAAHRAFPNETVGDELRIRREPLMHAFQARGSRWHGQVQELIYPVPIRLVDKTLLVGSRVRVGASEAFLDTLSDQTNLGSDVIHDNESLAIRVYGDHADEPAVDQSSTSLDDVGDRYAAIQRGEILIADLELLEG